MTRITIAEAERGVAAILERVSEQGGSYEIVRSDKVIAHVKPSVPKRFTVGNFREWWNKRERLEPGDAEQWEKEWAEIRASAKLPPSPWE